MTVLKWFVILVALRAASPGPGSRPEVRRLLEEQLGRVATVARQTDKVVPYLFPHLTGRRRGQRVGDFARAWRSACLRAGLAFKLEREGRPNNAGIPEAVCMTVTGHETRSTFDRYNIVSPTQKQEAARRIAAASEEAARRVAAAPSTLTSLAPRLVPTAGTSTLLYPGIGSSRCS